MVKRLAACAAVAAIAAILWVAFNIATSAEPDPQLSIEHCVSDGYVDCVSFDAPIEPQSAPVVVAAQPCKAWLGGAGTLALLSQCLHASDLREDQASIEEGRRRRAIAASS